MVRRLEPAELISDRSSVDLVIAGPLGAGVAVTLWDRESRVGGVARSLLPRADTYPYATLLSPTLFADRGVSALLELVLGYGARRGGLVATLTGAATPLGRWCDLGERNRAAAWSALERHGLRVVAEDTGGTADRTLIFEFASGRARVRSRGEEREL